MNNELRLAIAHAIEDAQYGLGFAAIVDRIPLLVQAFGGDPDDLATIIAQATGDPA